jgi:hypothetical protein
LITGSTNSGLEKMMPTKQHDSESVDREKQDRQELNALIGKHVMRTLGQPGDLHQVQVRQLWDDHYRVNVLVGLDASSVKVLHSFFLQTDGAGNIVTSTPLITRQY